MKRKLDLKLVCYYLSAIVEFETTTKVDGLATFPDFLSKE